MSKCGAVRPGGVAECVRAAVHDGKHECKDGWRWDGARPSLSMAVLGSVLEGEGLSAWSKVRELDGKLREVSADRDGLHKRLGEAQAEVEECRKLMRAQNEALRESNDLRRRAVEGECLARQEGQDALDRVLGWIARTSPPQDVPCFDWTVELAWFASGAALGWAAVAAALIAW